MARPQTRTDDEILDAARQLFLDQGPGATLRDVAQVAGLSQPAISQRFGSRDALLLRALTPRGLDAWVDAFEAPVGEDARATLVTLAVRGLAILNEAVPCLVVLRATRIDLQRLAQHGPLPHELVARAVARWFERWAAAGRLSSGSAERRAQLFIGALQAHALQAWLSRQPPSDDAASTEAEAIVDALWRGLDPSNPAAMR